MGKQGTHFSGIGGGREYGIDFPLNPQDGQEHIDNFNNIHAIYDATAGKWWGAALTTSTSTSTTTTSTSTSSTSTSTTTTSTSTTSTSTSTTTTL